MWIFYVCLVLDEFKNGSIDDPQYCMFYDTSTIAEQRPPESPYSPLFRPSSIHHLNDNKKFLFIC